MDAASGAMLALFELGERHEGIAFADSDLVNDLTWTDFVAQDMWEGIITITPTAAFVAGDEVFFFFYRDETVDTQTGEFHLTGLFLRYSDT